MITCPKCNQELSEGTKFCDNCGTEIFETIFCPNCGQQTSTEFAFCQSCGASIAEAPAEEQPAETPKADQPAQTPKEKKKLPKKAILFGGIGAAVLAVIILVIALLAGGNGGKKVKNNYALYLKDSEIFFTDLKKDSAAWQLTSRLIDTEMDEEDLAESGYMLGIYTYMSEDGKYLFFPDKINDDDEGFNLYYRDVANPEAEAVKIDSDVVSYTVNSSATIVTYIKGAEANLYQYKLQDDSKDKIASEVRDFEVSDDGAKISYLNSDGNIYLKYADKDKEKIAGEIASLEHVSADLSTFYYIKDGSLYKHVEGNDREKIASDVYDVLKIYNSGEIYYLTSESEEISLKNYVTDDMKDADASMTQPEYPDMPDSPDYPSYWDYDTLDEYYAAYDAYEEAYEAWEDERERLRNEYYAAVDAYNAKLSRDQLRERLESMKVANSAYSLCYFNGTENAVITDAYVGEYYYSNYTVAANAPVISYEAYNQASIDKVKLSEIDSVYDVENMVKAAMTSSSEKYIAVKGSATVIEQEKTATSFRINSSGTTVYYIDDVADGKNYGTLYRISIADGVLGKPEVYDTDVYTGYNYFVSDSQFEYFKDYKDSKGELYINKEKIDYDVKVYSDAVLTEPNQVIYFTDWNSEKEYGTLKIYQDGKSTKIADDVHAFTITPDGRVLYLYDYSMNHYRGELHEWDNGETRKLDEDVVVVLPIIDTRYRGY